MGEGGFVRNYTNKNKDLTLYYKVVYSIIFIVKTTPSLIPATLSVRTCAASFPHPSNDDVPHVFLTKEHTHKRSRET